MRSVARVAGLGCAAAAIASAIACTLLVPASETQCSTSADCRARGAQFANAMCVSNVCEAVDASEDGGTDAGANDPWACLSQAPNPSAPTQVAVQIILYNTLDPSSFADTDGGNDLTLAAYTPLEGASVEPCNPLDFDCAMPLDPAVLTDEAGVATFTVPGDFLGFYFLTKDSYVPTLFYPGRVRANQPPAHFPTSIVSQVDIAALASLFGVPLNVQTDAGPGTVSAVQFDCNDRHAAGVSFTTNPPGALTIYLSTAGLPIAGPKQTSSAGTSAILNMPAGSVAVTATLQGPSPRVVATANVLVRSGMLTVVYLRPKVR